MKKPLKKALFKKPPCDVHQELDYWRNKYYILLEEIITQKEKKFRKLLAKEKGLR